MREKGSASLIFILVILMVSGLIVGSSIVLKSSIIKIKPTNSPSTKVSETKVVVESSQSATQDPTRALMTPEDRKILEESDKITQKAIIEKNKSLCKESQGYTEVDVPISKEDAVDKCYFAYATILKDNQTCELISDAGSKSICLFKVAKSINSFTLQLCEQIKGDAWYFAECIAEMASRTKDLSICDKYFEKYSGDWNRCVAGPILKSDSSSNNISQGNLGPKTEKFFDEVSQRFQETNRNSSDSPQTSFPSQK